MPANLIGDTELIDVSSLVMLIYGPPGVWKTSVLQTADRPYTLDFDTGAHRAFNRKASARFSFWKDLGEFEDDARAIVLGKEVPPRFANPVEQERYLAGLKAWNGCRTVGIDTIGRCLDLLTHDIILNCSKYGNATGGLTLQGFGSLKSRFATWAGQARIGGRDLVMIAHEREQKDGDDRYMRPDIQGGSYTEVMKFADLVGYMTSDREGRRSIDWRPTDKHIGKDAAQWGISKVPPLADDPGFLAKLLVDAKSVIGKTAEASAAAAKIVDEWQAWLLNDSKWRTLEEFNAKLPDIAGITEPVKRQVKHVLTEHAASAGWAWDAAKKCYVEKSPQTEGVPTT
jgi:hypothetical protein